MTGLSCQAGRESSSIFYPLCHLGQAALSVAGSSALSGDHSTIYPTEGQNLQNWQRQLVVKGRRKRTPHSLLVGMQSETATLEDSLAVP